MFPAGSWNHAISGPASRAIPRELLERARDQFAAEGTVAASPEAWQSLGEFLSERLQFMLEARGVDETPER